MARGDPREQYDRVYILLPPDADMEWALAAVDASWQFRRTIGGSADDAGIGNLNKRKVVAVNPGNWAGDDGSALEAFFTTNYSGAEFEGVTARTAEEVRRNLGAFAQKPVTQSTQPFPGRGKPRVKYDRTYVLLPPGAGVSWARAVIEATWDQNRYSVGSSADDAGIGDLDQRTVIAVNPAAWGPGTDGRGLAGFYEDFYPGVVYQAVNAATPTELKARLGGGQGNSTPLMGMHDIAVNDGPGPACQWMMANGLTGWVYVLAFIEDQPHSFDFEAAAASGLNVVVNLRYSWSVDLGGRGTLPSSGNDQTLFVNACRQTIVQSKGVWGWTVGNEPNNPREWPTGGLTPERTAQVYNQVRTGLSGRFSPAPVDPFFGPGSDNREWFRRIWANVTTAEFVDMHGYVRGPDALLPWSQAKFQNAPLTWQFLNFLGCVSSLMDELPGSYRAKPVIISEFNHIWKSLNGPLGWDPNEGAAIIRAAAEAALGWNGRGGQQIAALTVYRWDGDEWAVKSMPNILNMVKQLNQDLQRPQFKYPVQGANLRINYYFGEQRNYGLHEGLDLFVNYGDAIVPVLDGKIEVIKDIGQSGYGRYVRVNHNNGYVSWYGHLRDFAPGIFVGMNVVGGQTVLGFGGNTGNVFPLPTPQNPTAGTHLHLTIQRPGFGLSGFVVNDVVDPLSYLV